MEREEKESFFKWKKIFVRSSHLTLVLFITTSLLVNNTKLNEALVDKNYPYLVIYILLTYLSILFYFMTCMMNPGYVRTDVESKFSVDSNTTKVISSQVRLRYCDYCKIDQPLRSRHCEECKRCISKFDHHCPWLETCIGERNHKYFWLFLGITDALITWSILIIWEAFKPYTTWFEWIKYNLLFLFDMQVLVISLIIGTSLFIIHTYFMLTNTTTWERFSRRNITYLRIFKNESFNPFHSSYLYNTFQFLCSCHNIRWENIYSKFIINMQNNTSNGDDSSSTSSSDQAPIVN